MNEVGIIFFCFLSISFHKSYGQYSDQEICYKEESNKIKCYVSNNQNRYIFYDVNPSEGFNLRRDVYMRFAALARRLAASNETNLKNFKLVLPPWSHLYHWTHSEEPELIPWGYYFDLSSLKRFAPVIEMHEFFEELGERKSRRYQKVLIDEVYVLKNWDEMMRTGNFVNKMEETKCSEEESVTYLYYPNITSNNVKCLKFHGPSILLVKLLHESSAKTLFFTHGEVALHPSFGDATYWAARRSLRLNNELRAVASAYREAHLSSTDVADHVYVAPKWEDEMPRRTAIGGPYLAVHMRRKDFFFGRQDQAPSLKSISKQIMTNLNKLGLSFVFLASDAPSLEIETLRSYLPNNVNLKTFTPNPGFLEKYKDGGASIVDQLICAHSRYFIGTAESTFTFRIFEEREIMGFPIHATYNVLCVDDKNCKKPTTWPIVY